MVSVPSSRAHPWSPWVTSHLSCIYLWGTWLTGPSAPWWTMKSVPTTFHSNDEYVHSSCIYQAPFQTTSLLYSLEQPRQEYTDEILVLLRLDILCWYHQFDLYHPLFHPSFEKNDENRILPSLSPSKETSLTKTSWKWSPFLWTLSICNGHAVWVAFDTSIRSVLLDHKLPETIGRLY